MTKWRLILSILIGLLATTTATATNAGQVLPLLPPPRPGIGAAPALGVASPGQVFVMWTALDVRCAGVPVAFTRPPTAMPTLTWWASANAIKPIAYSFTIDPTGRPRDIVRGEKRYAAAGDDLSPALAVGQFAGGIASRDCSLTFMPDVQPIATAPLASVIAYTIFPYQRPTAEVWARVKRANSTCVDPAPQVRTRAFPDFDAIPKQRGRQSWSMIGFDIDEAGKPVHVKQIAGNGNAALDAASATAVADSRFAAGARTGCQYPYWVVAETLPPPPMPDEAGFRPIGATCTAKPEWAVEPELAYPDNFRRRAIEGWAVIGYDVAPWGATGNVHVLASQPAEEFGEQALRLIASAKRVPSTTGYTGCVDRVQFRMGQTRRKSGAPARILDPSQPPD